MPVQQGRSMHCATEEEATKVKVKEKSESEAKKLTANTIQKHAG